MHLLHHASCDRGQGGRPLLVRVGQGLKVHNAMLLAATRVPVQ